MYGAISRHRRGIAAAVFLAALTALEPACQAPGTNAEGIEVRLTEDGAYLVRGRPVEKGRIDRALESAGGGPEMRVTVRVPANTPREVIQELARDLSAAGIRRFHFETERQATAGTAP